MVPLLFTLNFFSQIFISGEKAEKLFSCANITKIPTLSANAEADLRWGIWVAGGARPSNFFAITCSFAITLKNYKLFYLKLN